MRRFIVPLALSLAAAGFAFAWAPTLDDATAKAVVDAAYRRGPDVPTTVTLDLTVANGAFKTPNAVAVRAGGDACMTNWLQKPTDYAAFGSRPTEVIVAGQANAAYGAALAARDAFEYISSEEARERAKKILPDGQLRAYVHIAGLAREQLRDAYDVVALDSKGAVMRPVKVTFLDDWKAEAGRFSGTMVYYFDLSKAGFAAVAKLPLLLRTEADSPCAYRIDIDLGSFR
jgi:hypothetical protein